MGNRKTGMTFIPSFLLMLVLGVCLSLVVTPAAFAQETTGGIQGTVKDPSGAVIQGAKVVITGSSLIGTKALETDSSGYYRFANLPPGTYTVTVTATGFKTFKRDGLTIEVGHLPTTDIVLEVGSTALTVEVSGEAPQIDVTTQHTLTNVTEDVIKEVPHGYSFQSVIQFAPGARNEPLAGGRVGPNAAGGTGTGGDSPGNGSNGSGFGYSIGGGADSENAYLVEGQESADAIGGFSHTNVPFSFIQELQVKSTGVEAEYGGALGGVVNVVMQKGSNQYHGSLFSQFEAGSWDASPNPYPRYDPNFTAPLPSSVAFLPDASPQSYQPKKDGLSDIFPGFTFGGPILKDKLFFFVGFNPEWRNHQRTVNWNWPGNSAFPAATGPLTFSNNQQTYYTNARIDYAATQKIRVFGSWLYQYQRASGEFFPAADSTNGLANVTATSPPEVYGHNLGYAAPNLTTNVGADITLTPRLVGTVRWGYSFQNYHDFGMPTGGAIYNFSATGVGATDNTGVAIPASSQLSQGQGFFSAPNNSNNTTYNVAHRNQIDADFAWFKSGWAGTHNFKFGYQLMRLSNSIQQHFNEPDVQVFPGKGQYVPNYTGTSGAYPANCAIADPGGSLGSNLAWQGGPNGGCGGRYGYIYAYDIGSSGTATSMNHAFFAQDSWTIAKGVTINAGIRVEHEYLPAENQPQGGVNKPVQFGWGDKIAPRIGAAWDPFQNGKWKIFGAYGKYFDIMKLNLAISSFGGQYWNNCYYALNTDNLSSIVPVFNSNNRYCPGGPGTDATTQANFGSGGTPPGLTFIENQNFRAFPTTCSTCTTTEEGVAPGLKPYEQHETVFGIDHQLTNNLSFEARWDRRRLDNAIEDAALFNPAVGETFVIVNPGKGVNSTFDGFWNFLYGAPSGCIPKGQTAVPPAANCGPPPPTATRSFDGVEFRLTKATSNHWAGMFSYTYSHFRGNYTGLTNSDISDGGGGRNSPNNSRAFDEPFFYYGANGKPSDGLLPTDRPNTFKGYGYYELPWLRHFTTGIGIFQYFYQGSPVSSYVDVGTSFSPTFGLYNVPNAEGGAFPTYILPRGQFLPATQDPTTGAITFGTPYTRRTPWFIQTDFQFQQGYKVTETKTLNFSLTVPNLFNQRATTAYWQSMDTNSYPQNLAPPSAACAAQNAANGVAGSACNITNGYQFYVAAMSGYNYKALFNNASGTTGTNGVMTLNSLYGKPLYHQNGRTLYMSVKFTF
jgi:hypothetical protein